MTGFVRALPPVIAISVTWALLAAVLAGAGLLVRRLAGARRVDARALLASFWIGCAAAIVLLEAWHFLLPIGWPALAAVCALGAIGLALHARDLRRWVAAVWARRKPVILLAVLLAAWAANQAAGAPEVYDTYLYHLSIVRWYTSYPIVPGLGNLHERLAFNNSSLLLAAMLEVGPWRERSFHLLNGLLWMALMLQGVLGALRLASADPKRRAAGLFDTACVIVAFAMTRWISSLSTDLPAAALTVVAGSALLGLLLGGDEGPSRRGEELLLLCVALGTAISVKLSAAAFAALAGPVGLVAFFRRADGPRARAAAWSLAVPGLLLGLAVARNVVLSGYVVYPSTLAVDVPWRVPDWRPAAQVADVKNWARAETTEDTSGWWWLHRWANRPRLRVEVFLPLGLGLALLAWCAAGRVRARGGAGAGAAWWMLVPLAGACAFWFWRAPSARFGFHLFWMFAGLAACGVSLRAGARATPYLAVALACCALLILTSQDNQLIRAGGDRGFHKPRTFEMTTYVTDSGLELHVPVEGDQCGDAPLPCTPYPRPNLRLRVPGELGGGFVEDPPSTGPPATRPARRAAD